MLDIILGGGLIISLAGLTIFYRLYRAGEKKLQEKEEALRERDFQLVRIKEDLQRIQKSMNEEMNQRGQRFSTLLIRLRTIISSLDPEQIMKQTLEVLAHEMQIERAQIFLYHRDKRVLKVAYQVGMTQDEANALEIGPGEKNLVSLSVAKGETYLKYDIENDPRMVAFLNNPRIKTLMCTAIRDREAGTVLGALNIESLKKEAYTNDDRALFNLMRLIMDNALQNAFQYARQKNLTESERMRREEIKKLFGRYVSPAVVEKIVASPHELKLGGDKKVVTILASDIRGFTASSERLPPEVVVTVLNDYFTRMYKIIIGNGGTVDKFIGDACMVLFGAPLSYPDDSFRAVVTAVEMLEAVEEFVRTNEIIKKVGWQFGIGIGINTGQVIAGNIGAEECLNYTVIGDAVNLAFRLEEVAKPGQILVPENVVRDLEGKISVEKLEPIRVKGKKDPIQVYNVTGII